MLFSPSPGTTGKFTFVTGFEKINGVYIIEQILTFTETLSASAGIISELYTFVGKTSDEYETAVKEFRNKRVLKLVSVINTEIIHFVPEALIALVPDTSVRRYPKLVLTLDIGEMRNASQLGYLTDQIKAILSSSLGILSSPKFFEFSASWLTEDEISKIENDRLERKGEVINHYTQLQLALKEIDRLKVVNRSLSDIILDTTTTP